jgi:hypothetical protein
LEFGCLTSSSPTNDGIDGVFVRFRTRFIKQIKHLWGNQQVTGPSSIVNANSFLAIAASGERTQFCQPLTARPQTTAATSM